VSGKQWSSEAIELALAAQGISLAPGRGERLARATQALLSAAAADPLLAELDFERDAAGFALSLDRTKAR